MMAKQHIPARLLRIGAVTTMVAAFVSCARKDHVWRSYNEVTESAPSPAMSASGMATPATGAGLQWTKPDGWTEQPHSGMRIAAFAMGSGAETGLCTIVVLGGSAGGAEANVQRWLGQLGIQPLSETDLASFMAKQVAFESEGGFQGTAVDFTELGEAGTANGSSMLASSLSVAGSTMFIKLAGPVALLKEEKDHFLALCKSVRGL